MVKYEVVKYGREELRLKAVPVEKIDDELRQLARDMLATMYDSNGLGLAAEQVGRTEAVCVIDVPPDHDREDDGSSCNPTVQMPLVMINPRIVDESDVCDGQEGCLSFPEIYVNIKRAATVTVAFRDLEDREQTIEVHALLARAVQHEIDHLNGVLLVDRMSAVQRVAVAGKLRRIKKASGG